MIFERFYDERLAAATYLVGCEATGEALVVDPLRDPEPYLRAAEARGLRITHVTETHIHADFVSGSRELARRAGALLLLSGEWGAGWRYGFGETEGARFLRDGDAFEVGTLRLEAMHTPGHTPEHLSYLVTDTVRSNEPVGALTGDFLFVGDVGRPDLLERAAGLSGAADAGARRLFRSVRRFRELPDHLLVWPGHGAGSACGRALGSAPHTTLGYEKRGNWAFSHEDEDDFVRAVLDGQPEAPRYFREMKRMNRDGPPPLEGLPRPARLDAAGVADLLDREAVVVDARPWGAFAEAHLPGSWSVPLEGSFTTRAGSVVPYDRDLYLVSPEERLEEAVRALTTIGLDRIDGWADSEVLEARRRDGRPVERVPEASVDATEELWRRDPSSVLDVRSHAEWRAGHLPGATHVPLGELPERMGELSADGPVVVHCMGGSRSITAASLLKAAGLGGVRNLSGGLPAWEEAGRPVEREGGSDGDTGTGAAPGGSAQPAGRAG